PEGDAHEPSALRGLVGGGRATRGTGSRAGNEEQLMIHDVDRSLERLLRDRVPLRDERVSFDAPDEGFRGRLELTALTVNLFLYDLRENHELRTPDWTVERLADGRAVKRPPRARLDLCYLITAWSPATPPDVLAEHALLGRVLRTLLLYPAL